MQLPIRHLDEAVEEIEDDDADDDPAQDDPDEATDPDTNDADGGDAATDDAATDDAGTDDDAGIDPGPAESSIDGELVVGGTTYTPEDALVCEDDDSFPLDVELEFQVFAQGPDGPASSTCSSPSSVRTSAGRARRASTARGSANRTSSSPATGSRAPRR